MIFVGGNWIVTGEAADVRRSSERGNILAALEEATEPMSPSELADVTDMRNGNIRRLFYSMPKAQEVQKSGRGRYLPPKNAAQ